MAIIKRINKVRKVVSRFDPSWRFVMEKNPDNPRDLIDYCNTLNFEIIEKIGKIKVPFTVFEIAPLKVSHECYVNGKDSDWWQIFRSHVTSISEEILPMQGDKIKDEYREELPFNLIEDIGRMIVDFANIDGVSSFFTLPDGYWGFTQNCRRLLASEVETASASSADVKPND